MYSLSRAPILFLAILLLGPRLAVGQCTEDVSGHWEGAIEVPLAPVKIEVDFAKDAEGVLAGTLGEPDRNLRNLPLLNMVVDGCDLRFVLGGGPDPATFLGTLSNEGHTIVGEVTQGQRPLRFTLVRTGVAKAAQEPKSPRIAQDFEGSWTARFKVDGRWVRLILTMANQPDGHATGNIVSPDGSGIRHAVSMIQQDYSLAVNVETNGDSFALVLNPDGSQLVGTWSRSGSSVPLEFRKGTK